MIGVWGLVHQCQVDVILVFGLCSRIFKERGNGLYISSMVWSGLKFYNVA
jgi:hypothetical protein